MLKTLLKKQLKEFKYSYFRNRKTGKLRSKGEIIGFSILYFFLFSTFFFSIFGVTMGISIYVNKEEDIWVMFCIMAFITIFASTFINMLITRGILFEAKDNGLMLSLPIPDKYIIVSRMLNVLLNTIIYTFILWFPPFVYYFIFIGFDVLILIYGIVLYILITLIVVSLSCLFGYLISLLMKKIKVKNLIQTIITLFFLVIYYVIYFNANKIMTSLLNNLDKFSSNMKTKGILFYAIAKAAAGNTLYLFVSIGFTLLICTICFIVILKRYRSILIAAPSFNKKNFNGKYSKQSSIKKTLIRKELKLFFSNSTYTLNCGLGVLVLACICIALIIFSYKIKVFLPLIYSTSLLKESFPIVLIVSIDFLVMMDALSVPAVSLEGKNYWIVRTLPVSTYDVLNSKRLLQFRMHVIPVVVLAVICTFVFEINGISQVIFVLCLCMSCVFITYFDLFLGIMGANLKWNDEVFVIKQSGNIFVAIFGGMFIFAGIILLYMFVLNKYIDAQMYMIYLTIVFILISVLLDIWVKNKGVKKFESLG